MVCNTLDHFSPTLWFFLGGEIPGYSLFLKFTTFWITFAKVFYPIQVSGWSKNPVLWTTMQEYKMATDRYRHEWIIINTYIKEIRIKGHNITNLSRLSQSYTMSTTLRTLLHRPTFSRSIPERCHSLKDLMYIKGN